MNNKKVMLIGIAGASASGKTLLSDTIANELGHDKVAIISEDSYYKNFDNLSIEEKAKINFDHPSALDHDLMYEHLKKLIKGEPVEIPIYDFTIHGRKKETTMIENYPIIVVEGILVFVIAKLRELMDIKIYMDTPLDICFVRRLQRDMLVRNRSMESIINQYQNTVRPMYFQFIEPSKVYADIIVPRGGANKIAKDIIKAIIKEKLADYEL